MATLKQRLHRKNSNNYDIIHYETESNLCLRSNGKTVEESLNNLPKLKSDNNDPTTMLSLGEILISPNGTIFIGHNTGIDVYTANEIYHWKKYNVNTITTYYWDKYSLKYDYTENSRFERHFFQGGYYIQHGSYSIVNDGSGAYYKWSETPELSYNTSSWNFGSVITEYTSRPTFCYKLDAMGDGVGQGRYWSCTIYSIGSASISIGSLIGSISSSFRNQYPDNGQSGSYWYVYDRSGTSYSRGSYIKDVYDVNSNAYPSNGRHTDGYWYVKQ